MRPRTSTAATIAAICLGLTGCGVAGIPDSGAVHETTTTGTTGDEPQGNYDPALPRKGASPQEIVAGFLDAMTATPPVRTSVAREYLTKDASDAWHPNGMLIYDGPLSPRGTTEVEQTFADGYRTDASGAWLGSASESELTAKFAMTPEDGEWRISDLPQKLLVPETWFAQQFRQVALYFFDPSERMLIPEPVFVPRGPQFASALVNALLRGPSRELAATERSYLPLQLRSLVSVPVSTKGVARVDLTSDTDSAPMLTVDEADMMVSQLAWTLRQDPTISKFRVNIDDRPVQLPGETEFSVDHGHQYAPFDAGSSTQMFGLQDGTMIGGSTQNLAPVSGPFGRSGYDLRTVSPDLHAENVAGVSSRGDELWLAPVKDSGDESGRLIKTGEDLLRPAWDFTGRLWDVDRRTTGAVVYYLSKRTGLMQTLDVPGISGMDVKHFLVSRDGSRLIAVIRDNAEEDSIVVSRILSTADGQVVRALAAANISDPENPEGQVRDIAWRSPTTLDVLRPLSRQTFQVHTVSVDGASLSDITPVAVDGNVLGLAGTPVPGEKIYAFVGSVDGAPAGLVDLAGPRSNQFDVDSRITSLAYAG